MVSAKAGIDECIFAALRLIHRKLALRGVDRKIFGGWKIRTLFAKRGIVRRTNARGVPHPAGLVEHRIMRDRPTIPDSLLAPVWRRCKDRIVVSRRRIGVTYARLERTRDVMRRIEHRKIVSAQ